MNFDLADFVFVFKFDRRQHFADTEFAHEFVDTSFDRDQGSNIDIFALRRAAFL